MRMGRISRRRKVPVAASRVTIQILEGERAAVARDLEEGNPVEPGQMARVDRDLAETHAQADQLREQWERLAGTPYVEG